MGRILWVLPLCLILQDRRPLDQVVLMAAVQDAAIADPEYIPLGPSNKESVEIAKLFTISHTAGLPGYVPWTPLYQIGNSGRFPLENILRYQPTLFFQMCLDRYDRDVKGYTCVFRKQERVKNQYLPAEKVQVAFREEPFSVFFDWKEGAGKASKVLYVAGENNGKMLARAAALPSFFPLVPTDPDGAEAMEKSRYSIKQFGFKHSLERTLESMHKAEARGELHLAYHGQFRVPQLDNRKCYKFVRTPYHPVEEEGINELVLYIDEEHWLQVGSVLKDVYGETIAEYFFSDVQINPEFSKEQFTRKGW